MKKELRVDGLNFDQWKEKADGMLAEQVEFGLEHWADGPAHDEFEAGTTPNQYVFDILPDYDPLLKFVLNLGPEL
tara:strand:- start:12243 stop:12467 length:225 start_codon:yes stop_codon:yes gene_type:complete